MGLPIEFEIVQFVGFVLSVAFHLILLFFIHTHATKQFGSYKILMASFSIFSIFYAFVEILTQPIIHISGTGLMLYVGGPLSKVPLEIGHLLAAFYCSSFGLCVLFLSAHFFYRYTAVCSPRLLKMLEGRKVFRLFFPIFSLGFLMFLDISWFGEPNELKMEYLSDSLKTEYNDDIYTVGQISAVFYKKTRITEDVPYNIVDRKNLGNFTLIIKKSFFL
ncbi:hypothetical protein B9Z55_017975 [Caenorhabditis nigoni]|uniref:Uncharacterized protein n=1 Tax=Caenorhabditis nigoni TaxID=1611254 RepID=A0A2G5TC93_9PELO|nr:hypothetical protein B9Z55_017975 [Caenorhabditis nigoni]